MSYTVYIHRTPNDKYYVGITKQTVEGRWKNSLGYQTQTLFWRAIQKYGWDNIEHIIVAEKLTRDDACKLEIELIAKYQSNNPKYGYNRTLGGDGTCGFSHKNPRTAEWTNKIAKANTGKHRTEEQRLRMRNSALGKHHTTETKQKISENCKRINVAKNIIDPKNREKFLQKRRKPVYLLNDDGDIEKSFKSMTDCAEYLQVSVSLISKVINKKCKNSKYANKIIKGEWNYDNEEETR